MKLLIVTAAIALLAMRANADPLASYSKSLQANYALSLDQGGDSVPIQYLPAFNQSLGTLQAVKLSLTLSNLASFVDEVEIPNPVPTTANFTFGLNLSYGGQYNFAPITETVPTSYGPGMLIADAQANFKQSFYASTITPFESNCTGQLSCESSFYIDPGVYSSIDNPYTQDLEDISFSLRETFYYAPVDAIPEPASFYLMLSGCIGSIALLRLKRSKTRIF